mgnify:CR=1 FL=1
MKLIRKTNLENELKAKDINENDIYTFCTEKNGEIMKQAFMKKNRKKLFNK